MRIRPPEMIEDYAINLSPITFFNLKIECHYVQDKMVSKEKYLLPDTSALCNEIPFADIAMGWHESGLHFQVLSHRPFTRALYPNVHKGDSFEVFIDTRDMKTTTFNTRFCHHFFCFAAPNKDHIQAGEITRFRTEDRHKWCDSQELVITSELFAKGYQLNLFIPASCLHGYEPSQFNRLGITYRINTLQGKSQHFAAVSSDYPIEQHPSLWSSATLIK